MERFTYRLKDICSIKSGKRIPLGMNFTTNITKYPYIRARDIKGGKIQTDDLIYMDETVYSKIKKYIIKSGDIAITIVGASVGDVSYAQEEVDGFNLTENAVRLTNFNSNVNGRYLFYLLSMKQYRDYMQTVAGGAAQPKLGIYKVERIKVKLPKIVTQNRVATLLSSIDRAIDNNTLRIKLLEQMAENLYKEWFVRFRFPGHEKVEYINSKLGKIPSLFIATTMNEVFEDYIGGGWGNDEKTEDFPVSASVIRGADFPNVWHYDLSTCPKRYHKTSNYKSRQLQDGDIVLEISGGTSEQPVGRTILITQEMINRFEEGKVICASFCKLVRLKKEIISPYYFYFWMHYLYDTRIIDRYQLQSTGIINFKFEAFLKKGILMLPPKDLMLSFEEQMVPLFKEMNQLAMQNQLLTRQRDLLLPRLMSGKLEVNA